MRIYKRETLDGYPMTFLKEICWAIHGATVRVTTERMAEVYNASFEIMEDCLSILEMYGYLERVPNDAERWRTTAKGGALAGASTERKMTRKQTTLLLHTVLSRVGQINQTHHYLFHVTRVRVFGSYAKGAKYCSDLDLVVEIAPRPCEDRDQRLHDCLARAPEVFRENTENLQRWPEEEVLRTIKQDNPRISLHDQVDGVLYDPTCVIYDVYPHNALPIAS